MDEPNTNKSRNRLSEEARSQVEIQRIQSRTAIASALITAVFTVTGTWLTVSASKRNDLQTAHAETASAEESANKLLQKISSLENRIREMEQRSQPSGAGSASIDPKAVASLPRRDRNLIPYYNLVLSEVPINGLSFIALKDIHLPSDALTITIQNGSIQTEKRSVDSVSSEADGVELQAAPALGNTIKAGTSFDLDHVDASMKSWARLEPRGEYHNARLCFRCAITLSAGQVEFVPSTNIVEGPSTGYGEGHGWTYEQFTDAEAGLKRENPIPKISAKYCPTLKMLVEHLEGVFLVEKVQEWPLP